MPIDIYNQPYGIDFAHGPSQQAYGTFATNAAGHVTRGATVWREASRSDRLGWIEVTTLEQAQALDGKMVEVDASRCEDPKRLGSIPPGEAVRASLYRGFALTVEHEGDQFIVWTTEHAMIGVRLRVVEAKPAAIGGVTFSRPTQVPVGVRVTVDAMTPELQTAVCRKLPASMPPGEDVTSSQIERMLSKAARGCRVAVRANSNDWGGHVLIGANEVAVFDADRIYFDTRPAPGPEHFDCRSMPDAQALLDDASLWEYPAYPGMRPELAIALIRQSMPARPTSSVCSACKGAGTQLLTSACPECKGTGSITSASTERYSYALHETFRDGDQVWAIKHGSTSSLGYVLTAHEYHPSATEDRAMYTRVYDCTRDGRPLNGREGHGPGQPGSFLGEHDGERAVSGYVDHLNARPTTRR